VGTADIHTVLAGVDWTDVGLKFAFLTIPGVALAKGLKKFRALGRGPLLPRTSPAGSQAARPQPGGNPAQLNGNQAAPGRKKGRRAKASGSKAKGFLVRLFGRACAIVTMLGVGVAGLGLVPLAHVVFQLVSLYKWGPALTGLAVVVVGLAKVFLMVKDLKDGRVDKPMLWLMPLPLVAMLFWVGPVAWQQATDQARQTGQMMFGGVKDKTTQITTRHGGHKAHHSGSGTKP
jgi:hypothetical protein